MRTWTGKTTRGERGLRDGRVGKEVGKAMMGRLHSFLIQSTMARGRGGQPSLPPSPSPETMGAQSNAAGPARAFFPLTSAPATV